MDDTQWDTGDPCEPLDFYRDADQDGFGDAADTVSVCEAPEGYVADGTDCDDTDGSVHPDAQEVCDALNVDEDCDALADDADDSVDPAGHVAWHADGDRDGFGAADATWACDLPGEDWTLDDQDCDDTDPYSNPDADEVCDDGADNDCDTLVDEGCGIDGLEDAVVALAGGGGGFGIRVEGGDVTGDGVDDLVVGNYFVGADYEGGAVVFDGPLSGTLSMTDAVGVISGTVAEGALGWSVATTPDVDGDGVQDLLLGAPGTGGSASSIPGYAYLVTADPTGDLSLPNDARAVFVGAANGANAGYFADDVGDVTGDGVVDLLISAYQAHDLNGSTGQSYLFPGDVTGTQNVGTDAVTTLYGNNWAGGMGSWVSSGDLTGDGAPDLVISAHTSHVTGFLNGAVFVLSDPPDGVLAMETAADVAITGADWSGFGMVTCIGDWTGDGYDDLAATGSSSPGTVYVLAGPFNDDTTTASAVASFAGLGTYILDQTGWAIDAVDLDHDGSDDLAIGSPHVDTTTAGPGALDVFYGPLAGGATDLSTADVNVTGTAPQAIGYAVANVGDTTDDGWDELAITSLYTDGGAGAVWLFE